ncbi:MAG TPA: GMC family oxidoreductase [Acidimicrobiia bacterium]|nr:GMC family oxidoreductase [Acidimicrobiia bacterium]
MQPDRRFRVPGLRGVSAAILPPEFGGPAPADLAASLEAYLAALPTPARHAIRSGVMSLNAFSIAITGKTLSRNEPEARAALLSRLMRRPEGRHAMEGLKAFVLLVAGGERYADELLARWQQVPPVRPDADLDVTPAAWWPSVGSSDVIVIGSGAGGAFAARTLARAGLDVVIVEEGRRFTVDEFRSTRPIQRFAELYRDAGTTVALGTPPIALPIGRGVGGTTLINSGTCFRTPDTILRRWRDDAGLKLADPEAFAPYLDDAWETLSVAPVPLDVMGRNGRLCLEGAERLGWSCGPLDHNGAPCQGCCQSAIGCPVNAKYGVHLNALPQACAAGARIVSEARVDNLLVEHGAVVGVRARRADGTTIELRAPRVVVAAGAVETVALLRRSGLGAHPELGRNLAIHPAAGVTGRFEERVVPWDGVLQSAGVEQFHESDGLLIEATSTPPGMGSIGLPGWGRALVEQLDTADHTASLGAMVGDEPVGRVLGARRPIIRYDLSRRDGERLVRGVEVMGRILFAAGAREVYPGIPGHLIVDSEAGLSDAVASADPRELHLAAFHPTGTARAGADEEEYPVDPEGRLRGVDGVWVADACILPTCPEVNPQISIMALAMAVADGIASSG